MTTYTLVQTNAGGFFLDGMPKSQDFIAVDYQDAKSQAEALGVDFMDACDCCGARWNFIKNFDTDSEETKAKADFLEELRIAANR